MSWRSRRRAGQRAKPPAQGQRAQPRPQRRNRPPAEAPAPEVAAVEKAPDAKRVLVIGDFMAASLSKGLTDAYAQNANIVVTDASNGSSGLVRQDHYNWPAELPGLVAAQKPDAIVVMIGANDRQTMDSETGSQVLGTRRLAHGVSRPGIGSGGCAEGDRQAGPVGGPRAGAPEQHGARLQHLQRDRARGGRGEGPELRRHLERLCRRGGALRLPPARASAARSCSCAAATASISRAPGSASSPSSSSRR